MSIVHCYIKVCYQNRPLKVSTNFLEQLSNILSFSSSKDKKGNNQTKKEVNKDRFLLKSCNILSFALYTKIGFRRDFIEDLIH